MQRCSNIQGSKCSSSPHPLQALVLPSCVATSSRVSALRVNDWQHWLLPNYCPLPSSGHPVGFLFIFRHRFLSFSSSLHLPLLPSPPPVSASVFLLLVLVFHLSLLLPTTQGGSYLFSKLLHKKWRGGEVGTLDSRGMEQQLKGRGLTWSNPWTACSVASMKVKASFNTRLWETRGQILNSLANAVLRNNTIFLHLPSWQLKKGIQGAWIAGRRGKEDS